MKTAMQELIEKVEHAISYNVEGGIVEKYTWTELFNDMELALEKEKEQIVKAWDDGDYAYFYSKKTGRDFDNGEDYFNEKYQNK